MIFKSIRWRLQLWHGLILVVVLTGFGLTVYEVAWENHLGRIDQGLEQQFARIFRPRPNFQNEPRPDFPPDGDPGSGSGGPGSGSGPGFHDNGPRDREFWHSLIREQIKRFDTAEAGQTNAFYFIAWDDEGSVLARSANAPDNVYITEFKDSFDSPDARERGGFREFRGSGPGSDRTLARTHGEFREVFRQMSSGSVILAGRSMAPDLADMRELAFWFFAAGAGVLALGLAGGWWLASRAIRPVEAISATAGKIADGDLSQRINVADTESELGRLAGVLNSTFARLEAAFANQAQFTSDASHELRTPVSVILTHTQSALARKRTPDEYCEALEACQRSAQRMRKLTQSLLELARLDAGQEAMKQEPFDLASVVRENVDLIRPLAGARNLEIRCDLEPGECIGDAGRIGQVVLNLLTNAVHFNREGGEIRVTTRLENDSALLTVADTGEGITPEDLPHIFKRFYRGDKARSGVQGNSGLGLAICKAIVEASHGTIEVASRLEEGSAFTVRLRTRATD